VASLGEGPMFGWLRVAVRMIRVWRGARARWWGAGAVALAMVVGVLPAPAPANADITVDSARCGWGFGHAVVRQS